MERKTEIKIGLVTLLVVAASLAAANGTLKTIAGDILLAPASGVVRIGNDTHKADLQVTGHLLADGNVGVGTSSPGEKLEVDGNIKAHGSLQLNPTKEPTAPEKGTLRWDSKEDVLMVYDGSLWRTVELGGARNLVRNGGGEEDADRDSSPDDWGKYRGCGSGEYGQTSSVSHSGSYSTYIKATEHCDYSGGYINIRHHASKANGYNTPDDIPVEPNTRYRLDYWAKTELKDFDVYVTGWKTTDTNSRGRHGMKDAAGNCYQVKPADGEWHYYTCRFTTQDYTGYVSPSFGIVGYAKDNPLDTPLYIDDVELVEVE